MFHPYDMIRGHLAMQQRHLFLQRMYDEDNDDYHNIFDDVDEYDDDDDNENMTHFREFSTTSNNVMPPMTRPASSAKSTDEGLFSPWSEDGQEHCRMSDDFKDKGNAAYKNGDYLIAYIFYTDGLTAAQKVRNNEKQLAVLLCNRSHVGLKLNNVESALNDAKVSCQLQPHHYKGFVRLIRALYANGDKKEAINVGIHAICHLSFPSRQFRDQLLVNTLQYADETTGGYKMLEDISTDPNTWTILLGLLWKKKLWHIFYVLTHGIEGIKPIVTEYGIQNLSLHELLLDLLPADWITWGQQLTLTLMKKGVKYQTLCAYGKYPLHAALQIGIKTGSYDLLIYVINRYIPSADRDRKDADGNTLLHIACKQDYATKEIIIKQLLENKLDPTVCNNSNDLPIDLLQSENDCRELLLDSMLKKGFDVTKYAKSVTKSTDARAANKEITGNLPKPQAASCQSNSDEKVIVVPSVNIDWVETRPVLGWTAQDTIVWLDKLQLSAIKTSLADVGGKQLVELRNMVLFCPQFFYEDLRKKMNWSCIQALRFGNVLRTLK